MRHIKRGVSLADGPVVVVKVARPVQDQRFDIPGSRFAYPKCGCLPKKPEAFLPLAAGEVMMVEQEDMVRFADEHQMSIVCSQRSLGKRRGFGFRAVSFYTRVNTENHQLFRSFDMKKPDVIIVPSLFLHLSIFFLCWRHPQKCLILA